MRKLVIQKYKMYLNLFRLEKHFRSVFTHPGYSRGVRVRRPSAVKRQVCQKPLCMNPIQILWEATYHISRHFFFHNFQFSNFYDYFFLVVKPGTRWERKKAKRYFFNSFRAISIKRYNNYLRQGGYVFASVSLCVCVCVINITQKVTDQFLRKF